MLKKQWKRFLPSGQMTVIGIPFVWLLLFLVFPFAIVFKISFAEMAIARPPFTELFSFAEEKLSIALNLGNYLFLLKDQLYLSAYLSSLKTAAGATCLALLVGYPIAYGIARAHPGIRNLLLLGIVLPSWTSFLLRIYAWIGILKTNGLINNLLLNWVLSIRPCTCCTPISQFTSVLSTPTCPSWSCRFTQTW